MKRFITFCTAVIPPGLFKLYYIDATEADLFFLLKPVDIFVSLTTGCESIFLKDTGYWYESLNIIINKSCSGGNFLIMVYVMLFFLFIQHKKIRLRLIPWLLLLAWILTLFVNSSRIITSLFINSSLPLFFRNHLAEGIFIYFLYLTGIYIITDKILTKVGNNE